MTCLLILSKHFLSVSTEQGVSVSSHFKIKERTSRHLLLLAINKQPPLIARASPNALKDSGSISQRDGGLETIVGKCWHVLTATALKDVANELNARCVFHRRQ